MDNLQISYPNYFLFFIVVIALLYALSLYINDKRIKENKSWLPFILGWVRFLSILGILFLLLTPLLKIFKTETEKPQIIIANDISASVKASTPEATLAKVNSDLQLLKDKLSDNYDILEFSFGEDLQFDDQDSTNQQSTNISKPLEYISDAYEDQNLGAIILTTDGIYNEGKNPIYANLQFSAPIYSIALGDTTIRTDILVKNVLHNRIVYLNDKFLIEADIQAYNSAGSKSAVSLFVVKNGQQTKLDSKGFSIDSNNFFKSFQFEIEAEQIGNVKYIISVNRVNNEISRSNNSRSVYVDVLDARQKIMVLANAPHPDIKALKSLLTINKNYEVEIAYADNAIPNVKTFDMIIMHNLPSTKNDVTNQIEIINKSKIPTLFIAGESTNLQLFNNVQNVVTINGGNNSMNSVTPVLNTDFSIFTINDQLKSKIESFVPLKSHFGDYKLGDATKVLLSQKIGSVETQFPLVAYADINNHKQAVIAGEGIWRWKLIEFLNTSANDVTKELLLKSTQYISQKDDKRQFRAFANKNNYKDNENVLFDAQLYNENYELINQPEANLAIENEDGKTFEYTFSKENNFYFIDAGRFPEGNYKFKAATAFNGKSLTASGKFSIQSIIKEQYDLTAKHDILNQLSNKFGGEIIYPQNISKIDSLIASNEDIKPILYQKAETKPLMELQWLLGIILFLLALEWFIRRYFGGY
ncbi:MAG: hypothetical protein HKO66_05260 [Saprospiraceae bacterium]|nr:hypothetical protein [Bacteroidia bacterium]NNE13940.1 hypothetical protein [Saprospiraceae bacterium]NNL91616.1 hypothetical protein [Saprospiraceae bacterium]